jgi:hypothetical protein
MNSTLARSTKWKLLMQFSRYKLLCVFLSQFYFHSPRSLFCSILAYFKRLVPVVFAAPRLRLPNAKSTDTILRANKPGQRELISFPHKTLHLSFHSSNFLILYTSAIVYHHLVSLHGSCESPPLLELEPHSKQAKPGLQPPQNCLPLPTIVCLLLGHGKA